MPVVDGREYRSFAVENFQAVESSNDEPSYIVEGYATTFDKPYDFGRNGVQEMICRTAFEQADMSDIIFQYDHEGMVLARMRNNTLTVTPDEHGLFCRADLSGSVEGRNLFEAITNGRVDRMSWGFTVADDGWDFDREQRLSTIRKVDKVYDVSAVSIPANEATEISARSYFDGVIEAEQQELLQRKKEADRRKRIAIRAKLG